jgi:hypothetical protein
LYKDITHALDEIQPKLAETQRLMEKRDALRERVTVLLRDAQESDIQSNEIRKMLASLQADSKSSVQHIFNELRETLVKAATKANSDKENNLRKTIKSLQDKNDNLTKRIRQMSSDKEEMSKEKRELDLKVKMLEDRVLSERLDASQFSKMLFEKLREREEGEKSKLDYETASEAWKTEKDRLESELTQLKKGVDSEKRLRAQSEDSLKTLTGDAERVFILAQNERDAMGKEIRSLRTANTNIIQKMSDNSFAYEMEKRSLMDQINHVERSNRAMVRFATGTPMSAQDFDSTLKMAMSDSEDQMLSTDDWECTWEEQKTLLEVLSFKDIEYLSENFGMAVEILSTGKFKRLELLYSMAETLFMSNMEGAAKVMNIALRRCSESLAWLPFKARDTMFYYPPFYNSWAEYWWKVQNISEIYLPDPIHRAIMNGEGFENLIITFDATALERKDVILIKNYDINGESQKVYILMDCITWCNGHSWVKIDHQTLQQSTSEQIPITIGGTEYVIDDPHFKGITDGLDFLRSHMWSWFAGWDDGV